MISGSKLGHVAEESPTWSNSFEYHGVSGHVVNTVFVRGIWYCLNERGSFSTFNVVNNCWSFLGLLEGMYKQCSQGNLLSYVIKRGTQVYLCVHGNVFHEVLLEEPLEVTKNFRDGDLQVDLEYQMRSPPHGAFQKLPNEMEAFDTFNGYAWCGDRNVSKYDVIKFRWHHFRSFLNQRCVMDKWSCPPNNKECSTIVAWVEPVWVNPSADLGWMF